MDSLGDQQLMRKNGEVVEANQVLKEKKVICFYFSAHWCPPCREFTPVLADFYTELIKENEPVEIVFVSFDQCPDDMMGYMREAHGDWLAVQHGTVLASDLTQRFNVTGIPSLIVVNRSGKVVTTSGRSDVHDLGPQTFQKWILAASN